MEELYYHYTSLEVLYSIVSKNELWLSNLRNSNDPNECYLSCEEYNKYIEGMNIDPYHGTPMILSHNKVFGSPYGLSFTSLNDNLGQWERYGNRLMGVSISFDIHLIQEKLKELYGFSFYFDSIKYTEADKIEFIKYLLSHMEKIEQYDYERHWPYYALFFVTHFTAARALFKNSAFSSENEFRFYCDPIEYNFYYESISIFLKNQPEELKAHIEANERIQKNVGMTLENKKYAMMRNGINSYLSLDLLLLGDAKKHIIKEIVLGPKCKQDEEELENFMLSNGFSAKIRRSKIDIR